MDLTIRNRDKRTLMNDRALATPTKDLESIPYDVIPSVYSNEGTTGIVRPEVVVEVGIMAGVCLERDWIACRPRVRGLECWGTGITPGTRLTEIVPVLNEGHLPGY